MSEVVFDDSAQSVRVTDDSEARQYVLYVDGEQAGTMPYRNVGQRRVLGHTELEPGYHERGLSQTFTRAVLDHLRAKQQKVTVHCTAVNQFIKQHVEYADAIDPSHPGIWFP